MGGGGGESYDMTMLNYVISLDMMRKTKSINTDYYYNHVTFKSEIFVRIECFKTALLVKFVLFTVYISRAPTVYIVLLLLCVHFPKLCNANFGIEPACRHCAFFFIYFFKNSTQTGNFP